MITVSIFLLVLLSLHLFLVRGCVAKVLHADWIAARAHYSTFHWDLILKLFIVINSKCLPLRIFESFVAIADHVVKKSMGQANYGNKITCRLKTVISCDNSSKYWTNDLAKSQEHIEKTRWNVVNLTFTTFRVVFESSFDHFW